MLQLEYSRQSKIGKQSANDNPDSGNVRPKEIGFSPSLSRLFRKNLAKQDVLKHMITIVEQYAVDHGYRCAQIK